MARSFLSDEPHDLRVLGVVRVGRYRGILPTVAVVFLDVDCLSDPKQVGPCPTTFTTIHPCHSSVTEGPRHRIGILGGSMPQAELTWLPDFLGFPLQPVLGSRSLGP